MERQWNGQDMLSRINNPECTGFNYILGTGPQTCNCGCSRYSYIIVRVNGGGCSAVWTLALWIILTSREIKDSGHGPLKSALECKGSEVGTQSTPLDSVSCPGFWSRLGARRCRGKPQPLRYEISLITFVNYHVLFFFRYPWTLPVKSEPLESDLYVLWRTDWRVCPISES